MNVAYVILARTAVEGLEVGSGEIAYHRSAGREGVACLGIAASITGAQQHIVVVGRIAIGVVAFPSVAAGGVDAADEHAMTGSISVPASVLAILYIELYVALWTIDDVALAGAAYLVEGIGALCVDGLCVGKAY